MDKFEFIPGESFNSAVARWADEVGGFERMIDLTSVAGVRYGHRQQAASAGEADIRALAEEMQVNPDELLVRAMPYGVPGEWTNNFHPVVFAGVTVPSFLIERRVRRFSPTALSKSPHHRALWNVRVLPACTETGELLLDRCGGPDCGQLGWSATLGIDLCEHCMTDLTRLQATTIPEDTRATLAQFAGLFSHNRSVRETSLSVLPRAVAELGIKDIVDLLLRLMTVVDNKLPINPITLLSGDPLAVCTAVARSWEALLGWPEAVGEIAASRIAGRVGRHNDGNSGRTMRFLTRKHQLHASKPVRDLIAAWRRTLSVDLEEGRGLRERTVSGTTAAQITGLDNTRVVQYRRALRLKVHFALDLDRPEARFDREQIEEIRATLRSHTSLWRVREILGVPSYGVEQLLTMQLLEGIQHPFFDAHHYGQQVSKASLEALLAGVQATANPVCGRTLCLQNAMKAVGGRLKPWGEVFRMLVAEEMSFSLADETGALVKRVRVQERAVDMIQSLVVPDRVRLSMSTHMSKADAGEILNLTPARTTELLADIQTPMGSHLKLVPLEYVERLARRHVTVAEVAACRRFGLRRARFDLINAAVPRLGAGGFCRKTAEARLLAEQLKQMDHVGSQISKYARS